MSLNSRLRDLPLRSKLVLLFAGLLTVMAATVVLVVPNQMERQARRASVHRANAIAAILASAASPALEFEDEENASELLGWLEKTPETLYARVIRQDGTTLAHWSREGIKVASEASSTRALHVETPIRSLGGTEGTLLTGFSLRDVQREKATAQRSVALGTLVLMALGLAACVVLGSYLVAPIKQVTATAHRIASGESASRASLRTDRRDEVGQMAEALDMMYSQLQDASRQAGMAEISTGVLHNVGNVLNSINVSMTVVSEKIECSRVPRLRKAAALALELSTSVAPEFVDERLPKLAAFLGNISEVIAQEHALLAREAAQVREDVDHVKNIVAMQNTYARAAIVAEEASPAQMIDHALKTQATSYARHDIKVERDDEDIGDRLLDKHRTMQILINLLANAKDALRNEERERVVSIRSWLDADQLTIEVRDNGMGIAKQKLDRIFALGFTTKVDGHGYGLHASANTATEMGGSLECSSEGIGLGACFTLRLPCELPRGAGDA